VRNRHKGEKNALRVTLLERAPPPPPPPSRPVQSWMKSKEKEESAPGSVEKKEAVPAVREARCGPSLSNRVSTLIARRNASGMRCGGGVRGRRRGRGHRKHRLGSNACRPHIEKSVDHSGLLGSLLPRSENHLQGSGSGLASSEPRMASLAPTLLPAVALGCTASPDPSLPATVWDRAGCQTQWGWGSRTAEARGCSRWSASSSPWACTAR
jgi:hypothetical protein